MTMHKSAGVNQESTSISQTTYVLIDVTEAHHVSVQFDYSDNAPAIKTFADANVGVVDNTITIASHGYTTGLKVAATTSGVLPGGLSATNYYVIKVDASTIKLASSLANAEAGTAVDITSAAGGGTHTLTPATAASNVVKLQSSNDGITYSDISGTSTTIATSSGSVINNFANYQPRYLRAAYIPSAGQINLKISSCVTLDV